MGLSCRQSAWATGSSPVVTRGGVRVSPDRNDTDAGVFCRAARALRPLRNACDDVVNAPLNGRRDRRVVIGKPFANLVEVLTCPGGVDNLHRRRNLANAAATSASV